MTMARESKKPTVKQMMSIIESQTQTIEQQNQMIRVVFQEVDKLNMVVIRLLEKQGLLHNQKCSHCDFNINTPLLDDIELPTHCPACQKELAGGEEE
jgi:predicted Zn-ribbon and HTH transcriptional regulator